ncbi:lymphocyte activation gene 3 protein [Pholidichthys leucotaenia]
MIFLECLIIGVVTFLTTGVHGETEVFAEAGSQAVLPCACSGSISTPPAIVWSKSTNNVLTTVWRKERSGLQYRGAGWVQNGLTRVGCPHPQNEKGDCSLQISGVRQDDGGLYTCKVDDGGKVTEDLITLRVIKVSVSPAAALWGDDVSVTCEVTPPFSTASLQWVLNNRPYVPQTETTSRWGISVVKERATKELSGKWTCVVRSRGKEGRASASLSVSGIIQPAKDNMKVYASVGSSVSLPCVFSPALKPVGTVWEKLKPGFIFKPAIDSLPASFSSSSPSAQLPWDKSATLKQVGPKDEGLYRCAATVQRQRLSRTLQLVVAKIVSSKKKNSLTLSCQLTDTSEVTEYEWVHVRYDINGSQSAVDTQRGKTLSTVTVSEGDWGQWTCHFYGKNGILGNVTQNASLMSGLSGEGSSGSSQNTAAIIGLTILLLVLLLILAQMYKNHQRRKKIFQYPALETIVHTISNEREERARTQAKKSNQQH